MVCLLLLDNINLLFYNLMVGASGVVMSQHGLSHYWLIPQGQVDDQFTCVVFSCPMMGGWTIISNFQSIFVNYLIPEDGIWLHLASWIALSAVCVEVPGEDGAAQLNESPPTQFLY